jgi:RecA/RadA recombinase
MKSNIVNVTPHSLRFISSVDGSVYEVAPFGKLVNAKAQDQVVKVLSDGSELVKVVFSEDPASLAVIDEIEATVPNAIIVGSLITEALIRSGGVDIIVVDSVAALVPKSEIEGEMGDAQIGVQARLMSQALRKLTSITARTQTTVIFTNQIRHKIGVFFGNPETTPGGLALKFYTSIRMDVRKTEKTDKPEKVEKVKINKEDKQKEAAVQVAVEQIQKQFGMGSIMKLGDRARQKVEVIPSGILPLDVALGVGGIPKGRIVEIFGPEASGKTTISLNFIAQVQKEGGIAAFVLSAR